jgi:hypothetical protein
VNFRCEDLPKHGLELVPPVSPDYAPLLADIERRLADSVDGSPPFPEQFRHRIHPEDRATSAILLNKSSEAIAGLYVVWHFETETGRSYRHSQGMLSPQQLLLPFGRSKDPYSRLYAYWHTILPGSKRYLAESGMMGDNTDVRLPAEDEKWRGGMIAGRNRGGGSSPDPVKQVTLVLDGVFFLDGEFVGPDAGRTFDQTIAHAEAHMTVARIARESHDAGLGAAQILAEIEKVTGPAPEHHPPLLAFRNPGSSQQEFLEAALQTIAFQLSMQRRFPQAPDQDQLVSMIMDWNRTVLPHFRKAS